MIRDDDDHVRVVGRADETVTWDVWAKAQDSMILFFLEPSGFMAKVFPIWKDFYLIFVTF